MKISKKIILWLAVVQISLLMGVGVCFPQEFSGDKQLDAAIRQVINGNCRV